MVLSKDETANAVPYLANSAGCKTKRTNFNPRSGTINI